MRRRGPYIGKYRIEKGVPISEFYLAQHNKYGARNGHGKPRIYPFADMEVGDSFLLDNNKRVENSAGLFRQTANTAGRQLGYKFLVIRDDNHQWRCYRIE